MKALVPLTKFISSARSKNEISDVLFVRYFGSCSTYKVKLSPVFFIVKMSPENENDACVC